MKFYLGSPASYLIEGISTLALRFFFSLTTWFILTHQMWVWLGSLVTCGLGHHIKLQTLIQMKGKASVSVSEELLLVTADVLRCHLLTWSWLTKFYEFSCFRWKPLITEKDHQNIGGLFSSSILWLRQTSCCLADFNLWATLLACSFPSA